jgi:Asp/Glu/hydantoin racemase
MTYINQMVFIKLTTIDILTDGRQYTNANNKTSIPIIGWFLSSCLMAVIITTSILTITTFYEAYQLLLSTKYDERKIAKGHYSYLI